MHGLGADGGNCAGSCDSSFDFMSSKALAASGGLLLRNSNARIITTFTKLTRVFNQIFVCFISEVVYVFFQMEVLLSEEVAFYRQD